MLGKACAVAELGTTDSEFKFWQLPVHVTVTVAARSQPVARRELGSCDDVPMIQVGLEHRMLVFLPPRPCTSPRPQHSAWHIVLF